eukprot:scaffold245_cov256-Pinguiococcus_pyrenoidosus.AAC.18
MVHKRPKICELRLGGRSARGGEGVGCWRGCAMYFCGVLKGGGNLAKPIPRGRQSVGVGAFHFELRLSTFFRARLHIPSSHF